MIDLLNIARTEAAGGDLLGLLGSLYESSEVRDGPDGRNPATRRNPSRRRIGASRSSPCRRTGCGFGVAITPKGTLSIRKLPQPSVE